MGDVAPYSIYRVQGTTITPTSVKVLVGGASVPGTTLSLIDQEELPDNVPFIYFIQAVFTDGSLSSASNFSSITREERRADSGGGRHLHDAGGSDAQRTAGC